MKVLDDFLTPYILLVLKDKLGNRIIEKINRLHTADTKIGFSELDLILHNLFGQTATDIELDIIQDLFSYDKKSKHLVTYQAELNELLIRSFGDPDKKKILLSNTPDTIQNLLNRYNIPQSSGYRMFDDLIASKILVRDGQIKTTSKNVPTYIPLFQDVTLSLSTKNFKAMVIPRDKFLKESFIVKALT